MGRKQDIMEATYDAVAEHGYAELSIQKIADEIDAGKSLIYYHFDDREELMVSFLDYMIDDMEDELDRLRDEKPQQRLEELVDFFFGCDCPCDDFHRALREVRAASFHDEELESRFQEIDSVLYSFVLETFQDLESDRPQAKAELLLSALEGGLARRLCGCDVSREAIERIIG